MAATNYRWDPVSDNLLMETDQNGQTIATYTHEPGPFGQLISQHRNGQTYCNHYDALGNVTAVTDQNGNIVETASYSAFGEVIAKSTSIVNPFGYVGALGYYANPSSDNLYVRARFYSPDLARWLSRDPLGRRGNNSYEYASNNPLLEVDLSGLSSTISQTSTGTVPGLFGSILGLALAGKITGACGQLAWNVKVTLDDIDYFGAGNAVWLFLKGRIDRALKGGDKKDCTDSQSRCCIVAMFDTQFSGTIVAVLKDVPVPNLFFKPDPGVTISFSGKSVLNLGVCVKKDCPCPPQLPKTDLTLTLGKVDLGTIEYAKLEPLLK